VTIESAARFKLTCSKGKLLTAHKTATTPSGTITVRYKFMYFSLFSTWKFEERGFENTEAFEVGASRISYL
jgi:hypothetical protein